MQPPDIIIEKNQRLSKSVLWSLQTAAYCQFGPKAWSDKGVPFYPTSNPFIARQYAQVVIGYLRDCLTEGSPTKIDLSEPVYILDLGAGTGRFGYLFLKNLIELLGMLRRDDLKIRYVMTDIAPSNIAFWKAHPYLQTLTRLGLLDFAFYHHEEQEKPLELILSGATLTENTVKNPLIVIGNYFFDTIPQDLFKAKGGKILEGRVTLSIEENENTKGLSAGDPAIINYLKTSFDYVSVQNIENYYPDFIELNALVNSYAQLFEDIPFLFPSGAFYAIRYFTKLSKGRLLILAGDQGRCTEKQLQGMHEPYISRHGSFSIPVNYHAIARYIKSQGGISLLTTHPQPQFIVTASALGGAIENFEETAYAFKNYIDVFEPNDYFLLMEYSEKEWIKPSLEAIILLLKFGNWDPINCHLFFTHIREQIPQANETIKERLADALQCVWENFYPVEKAEAGFVLNLGVLFFEMGKYQEALLFFEHAWKLDEENVTICNNSALCCDKLGLLEDAQKWRKRAKAVKAKG